MTLLEVGLEQIERFRQRSVRAVYEDMRPKYHLAAEMIVLDLQIMNEITEAEADSILKDFVRGCSADRITAAPADAALAALWRPSGNIAEFLTPQARTDLIKATSARRVADNPLNPTENAGQDEDK